MTIPHLTFTRFIAAFAVIVFHFAINGGNHVYPFNIPILTILFSHADLAVIYFFILSGFLMAFAYYTEDGSQLNVKKFYVSRFARIYPIYLVSVVLYLGIGYVFNEKLSWLTWLSNIFLVQAWFPGSTLNFAAWSLSAELFYYLLFPLVYRVFL